ncbi:hypothetical protein J7K43_09085 [Candidatus Calescamantes bacterium]|nr:hypothetical protein [Candidatus Calescamantes bacterium]
MTRCYISNGGHSALVDAGLPLRGSLNILNMASPLATPKFAFRKFSISPKRYRKSHYEEIK